MRRFPFPFVFLLTFSACGTDFPDACDEEHRAVDLARSLTAEQLMFLHDEMFRLRDEAGDPDLEFGPAQGNMPENLKFLGAVQVRPKNLYHPNIMLADCFASYVYLNFHRSELSGNRVELLWTDSSSGSQKQVLWQATHETGVDYTDQ